MTDTPSQTPTQNANDYTGKDIEVLEGLEPVRKRPDMYINDTGEAGFQHCALEIIDNATDEALAGFCTSIDVIIQKNGGMTVTDNGRGIPVDIHPTKNISAATVIFTVLHAGGKFNNDKANSSYTVSGGLHGVGSSVVNALSVQLVLIIWRDGHEYRQAFKRGIPTGPLKCVGKSDRRGTSVSFLLDPEIFKPGEDGKPLAFNAESIKKNLAIRSYLNPGLQIRFMDLRTDERAEWKATNFSEILDMLSPPQSPPILPTITASIETETSNGPVSLMYALRVQNENKTAVETFANSIRTKDGGSHEAGLKAGILRAYNRYADVNGLKKCDLVSSDVMEGLVAAVAVRLNDPQFAGQTKGKLNNSYIRGVVESAIYQNLMQFFEEHPKEAKAVIARAERAASVRAATEKVREKVERKSLTSLGTLPGKLADCQNKDPETSELFIVEGDSAGGSAKDGRNRFNQAVLPLRGKIKNAIKASNGAMDSEEARNLIIALGCGSVSGKNFDISKLRYNKIIILTDADTDGEHIFTLAMTILYTETPELIRRGHIYIAQPPLYRVRKNKEDHYLRNDADLKKFFKNREKKGWLISRFKGLGEMNAEQLGDTTLDPAHRSLTRILFSDQIANYDDVLRLEPPFDEKGNPTPPEDPQTMDKNTFHTLMGRHSENRKTFIASNTSFSI